MNLEKMGEEEAIQLLENKFECRYLGRKIPPCYHNEDECEMIFRKKCGQYFYLPACSGKYYNPQILQKTLQVAGFNVVSINSKKPVTT